MSAERAYVERVSLKSRSRAGLKGIVPELEDALRTTSWPSPGGTADAVLLIKKLDLGRIRPGTSRHQISRLMAARLNDITLNWTLPGAEPEGAKVMMWRAQPAMLASCAIAILRSGSVSSLPWWVGAGVKADRDTHPSISLLIKRITTMVEDSGPAAFVDLLQQIIRARHPDVAAVIVTHMTDVLGRFAFPILNSAQPSAIVPMRSVQHTDKARLVTQEATRRDLKAVCIEMLTPKTYGIWQALEAALSKRQYAISQQIALLPVLLQGEVAPASVSELKRQIAKKLAAILKTRAAVVNASEGLRARRDLPTDEPRSERKIQHDRVTSIQQNQTSFAETEAFVSQDSSDDALPTRAGGMPMLLNLIEMAGLPEIDAQSGADVSLRVLRNFVARIPDHEAMLNALPEIPDEPALWANQPLKPWMPSLELLRPFAKRLVRINSAASSDFDLLGLRGSALVFGIGAQAEFAGLYAAGLTVEASVTPTPKDIAGSLSNGVGLLLQRHIFDLTGKGWRYAAMRPGYVAATRTHIDVTLDLEDVHIAERLTGLDLTPGWVGWLGRVVTLHFEGFEKAGRMQ